MLSHERQPERARRSIVTQSCVLEPTELQPMLNRVCSQNDPPLLPFYCCYRGVRAATPHDLLLCRLHSLHFLSRKLTISSRPLHLHHTKPPAGERARLLHAPFPNHSIRSGAHGLAVVQILAVCAGAYHPHICFLQNRILHSDGVRTAMPRDSSSPPAVTHGGGTHTVTVPP